MDMGKVRDRWRFVTFEISDSHYLGSFSLSNPHHYFKVQEPITVDSPN